jgi:hypothetical protein
MTERRFPLRATTSLLAVLVALIPVSVTRAQAETTSSLRATPEGEIPPVLYTSLTKQDRTFPTWVSADAAVDAEGMVDPSLFHPFVAEDLQALLRDSPEADGCLQLGDVYTDVVNAPDRSSLAKAAKASDLVAVATVIDREYGFRFMEAGQLLTIRVEEVLRGDPKLGEYFIFIPSGRFRAGPYEICKSDSRFPEAPAIGDEVVVLVPEVENPLEPYLDLVWDTSLVVLRSPGEVSLPKGYTGGDRPGSRAELIQQVRAMGAGR